MQEKSCDFDPTALSVATALEKIKAEISNHERIEEIALSDALGRVLATAITSPHDVPNHTNSAMDGYAVRSKDFADADAIVELQVVGQALAGAPYNNTVSHGQCVRIMTGAVMPQGADTVVMQENVQLNNQCVQIPNKVKGGDNVRYAGEDIKAGQVALEKGCRLDASRLGVIASLGLGLVKVFQRPKVAFFSNGDELRSIGEPLALGEVYDSNRYTLRAMIEDSGAQALDFGVVKDDEEAIRETLSQAAAQSDMIISTAGASVGDADYIKKNLDDIGQVNFWKVAIKPGRPLSFGKIGESIFFGLPGNPVSVMVTFRVFVAVAIKRLAGEDDTVSIGLQAKTLSDLKKRAGRTEYQRGILSMAENGEVMVQSTGDQGSGILSSMSRANCFILLDDDCAGVKAGSWVRVQPF